MSLLWGRDSSWFWRATLPMIQWHCIHMCIFMQDVWIHSGTSSLHDLGNRDAARVNPKVLPLHMNSLHNHCTQGQSVLKDFSGENEIGSALIVYTGKLFILCTDKKVSYQVVQESPLIFLGLSLINCMKTSCLPLRLFPEGAEVCVPAPGQTKTPLKLSVTLMLPWAPASTKSERCVTLVWIAHEARVIFVC